MKSAPAPSAEAFVQMIAISKRILERKFGDRGRRFVGRMIRRARRQLLRSIALDGGGTTAKPSSEELLSSYVEATGYQIRKPYFPPWKSDGSSVRFFEVPTKVRA